MRRLQPIKINLTVLASAAIGVLVLMWLAAKCTNTERSAFGDGRPHKSGGDTLDVVIEISPLLYSLAHDTVSGLDYNLMTALAHGWHPVKFHPMVDLEYGLRGLREGTFDILISSLPSTSGLKDSLLLTNRVYLDHEVLVQRRDDPGFAHAADALGGDTVWIAEGSPFAERLGNLADEIGDTIIVQSRPGWSAEYLVMLVATGQLRRAVVNQSVARRMLEAYPNLDASTSVSFTQFQTWALAPGHKALRDTINRRLHRLQGTPTYDALLRRYLSR